jgi:hypothetical protein
VWEQLNVARHLDTTQIWILNIGDLKFQETGTEWFLSMAYDSDRFDERSLADWLEGLARRDFGLDDSTAKEVGQIMGLYSVSLGRTLRAFPTSCHRTDTRRCTPQDEKPNLSTPIHTV